MAGDRDYFPFGVYDTDACRLIHIGLHTDEDDCWKVYLGWPDQEEIDDAKSRGLKVVKLTVSYDPNASQSALAATSSPPA